MTNVARDLQAAPAPLQRRVLLAYGVGDAGTGMASALVGFYLFVFYTALLGIWIWNRLAARRSRLLALQIGGSAWILLCLLAILLPVMPISGVALAAANRGPLLLLLVSLMGLGISAATAYLLPWSFLPDAIDAEANHPAGLITAFLVQIQKLGSALSVFVLGLLLSWSGYQASLGLAQPPQALLMIRLCMGLLPALLVGAGLWVMRDWERIGAQRPARGGDGG